MMKLSLCSLIALLVILGGGFSPFAMQKRNLVGPLKNKDVVSGCGCYFYFGRDISRSSKEIFVSGVEEEAWMNIDGVDMKLQFVSRTEPTRRDSRGAARVGSRHTEKYAAGDVNVDVFYTVRSVCPSKPVGPPCEGTDYFATFRVRKGRRIQVVKGNGACGC